MISNSSTDALTSPGGHGDATGVDLRLDVRADDRAHTELGEQPGRDDVSRP